MENLDTMPLIQIIILSIIVIAWFYFIIFYKHNGVVQRGKTYGGNYFLTTQVYVNGIVEETWVDILDNEKEFLRMKKKRKKDGELEYIKLKKEEL